MNVVWFKRDLRVHDHAPLAAAAAHGPVVPLYVIEPEYWGLPDTSKRQFEFVQHSLKALNQSLSQLGQPLWLYSGSVVAVLEALRQRFGTVTLFSHMETGNGWTFERDLAVKRWAQATATPWHEYRQHGVVRGLQNRGGWAEQWETLMAEPEAALPNLTGPGQGPWEWQTPSFSDHSACQVQAGGEQAGLATLDSFLSERGRDYRQAMSSPLEAADACSRLSPHLALGTVSLRRVLNQARQARAVQADATYRRSLQSFDKRLHWHCHFIQKLESEPRLEFEPLHRGFSGLKPEAPDAEVVERWIEGHTGWPFVDACMRSLKATGWLNFRMRAMVVALSAYHLWQPWRAPALKLAQRFVDYEPGIHFSQVQMQSGTTGINVNRIYNPIKQSMDQDPDGTFIRRWVPELAGYTGEWVHQPWRAPVGLQRRMGALIGQDYSSPIADPIQAAREAKAKLTDWIRGHDLKPEAARVLRQHGSRMRQTRPKYTTPPAQVEQGAFDFGDPS